MMKEKKQIEVESTCLNNMVICESVSELNSLKEKEKQVSNFSVT